MVTMTIQLFSAGTLGIRGITFRRLEEICLCNKEINIPATQRNNPAERIEFSSQVKCLMVCVCRCVREINYCRWVVQSTSLIVSVCPLLGGRVLFKVKFYWSLYILVVRKKILWVRCSSD